VGYTIGPLLVFALLLVSYRATKSTRPELSNRIFSYFLTLTFLILPSVSIKIFSTFACRTFDNDYGSFLKADYNIDCDSEEHQLIRSYAMLMCLVYPFGVPFMYAVLLYRKRHLLDPGQAKFTHELGSEELGLEKAIAERQKLMLKNPGLESLSFLYDAYEPQCWWFEVVETLRRLLLTGGLLFLNPGTGGQVVASMIMCLGAMRIYAGYKPFVDKNNDLLAETAQWQLFFTMFAALAIRVNVDNESVEDKQMFDIMLCAIQFAGVGVGLIKFALCKSDADALREEAVDLHGSVKSLARPSVVGGVEMTERPNLTITTLVNPSIAGTTLGDEGAVLGTPQKKSAYRYTEDEERGPIPTESPMNKHRTPKAEEGGKQEGSDENANENGDEIVKKKGMFWN
jgi:hypothetical protein